MSSEPTSKPTPSERSGGPPSADEAACVQDELLQSRKRYQALIETNVDFIWELDAEGRYTYCSPQMEKLWGIKPEAMLGKTPFDVMPPDERKSALQQFRQTAQAPNPFRGLQATSFDAQGRTIFLETNGVPFFDESGRLLGFRGVTRDVTAQKQAVEALRRHEDFLSFSLATAHMGVWDLDLEDHTSRRSLEHDRIFGYSELLPRWTYETFLDHVLPEDRAEVDRKFRRACAEHSDWSFECRIRRRDGQIRWIWAAGRPRRDGHGQRSLMAGIVQDITERMHAEEALFETSERLRIAAKAAGLGIHEYDVVSGMLRWDARVRELWGIRPDEPVTYETFLAGVHPDDRDDVQAAVSRALEPANGGEFAAEYRVVNRRDGRVRWVAAAGQVSFRDGRAVRLVGTVQDVTERRRSEERIATLARLYEVLSRANESIVRTADEQSLYEQICRVVAEVGGFPLVWIGLLSERTVKPVAWAGPATSYLSTVRIEVEGELGQGPTGTAVREGRSVVNDDFDLNPATVPWRLSAIEHGFRASAAFPLRHQGETIGAITLYATRPGAFDAEHIRLLEALCADLSYALDAMAQEHLRVMAEYALRQSEQNLRDADHRKNQFMATLSHELRNPLTPVKNSLYILDRAPPDSERARRAREVIERQVDLLSRLVDDLLDVTRIARGKIQLQRQRCRLDDLVRRTLDDHRTLFERSGLDLGGALGSEEVWVHADWNRMAQVVGNLLQNASKFTPAGGRVTVELTADRTAGLAVLTVTDSGMGMAKTTLVRLFEPFMQADATLARSKGGLGLGLALAKGLVEQHGGSIEARSPGLGQGSVFTLRLPLDPGEPAGVTEEARAPHPASRRVLVIDDNADVAESLREVLQMQGHCVAVASDGVEGIARARELHPDLVLCDIGLPNMDGYEIARRFRSDDELRNAQLVALSGYALPEDIGRALDAGFDQHVAKPATLEKLEDVLRGRRGPG